MGGYRQAYVSCVINAKNKNEKEQENRKVGVEGEHLVEMRQWAIRMKGVNTGGRAM